MEIEGAWYMNTCQGVWKIISLEWAGSSHFIRVMLNTPTAVGQAATVMSLGGTATEEDGVLIDSLFGAIGRIWRTNEELFDAVTRLSGSGPTYIYLVIEALADGGVAAGLPRELALGLASQTVLGAASMAIDTGKHSGHLKDDVTSPGGTTIAAIHELAGERWISWGSDDCCCCCCKSQPRIFREVATLTGHI